MSIHKRTLALSVLVLVNIISHTHSSAINSDQTEDGSATEVEPLPQTTLFLQQIQPDLRIPQQNYLLDLTEDESLNSTDEDPNPDNVVTLDDETTTTFVTPTTIKPVTKVNYASNESLAPPTKTLTSHILKAIYQAISSEESQTRNITSMEEDSENSLFNETSTNRLIQGGVESSDNDNRGQASEEITIVDTPITTIPPSTSSTTAAPATRAPVIPVRQKQPKHIKKFKAQADEVLRIFLANSYLRPPLGILVDTSPESLQKTKILWNGMLKETPTIEMALIAFDPTGIRATYNFKTTRELVAGLNSIQKTTTTEKNEKTFFAILKASELIPYDSAIFLFTDSNPTDTEMAQIAAIILLKKRIRLYLFWFGSSHVVSKPGDVDTDLEIGSLALRTGGEIIYMTKEAINSSSDDIGPVTLLLRNNWQSHHFGHEPIDHTHHHHPHQPHREEDEVEAASSLEEQQTNAYETTMTTTNGVEDVEIIFNDVAESRHRENMVRFPESELQTKATENEEADEPHSTLDNEVEITDLNTDREKEAAIESNTLVNISPQSKLNALPGSQAQIYFEVTNLRNVAVTQTINVVDQMRYVRQTTPYLSILIPAGQTATVTVLLVIPQTAEAGTRNKVTFTARGVSEVIQSVYFTVASQNMPQDSTAPSIYYTYGNRCEWKTSPGTCSQYIWSVEISAQDWDTGILRIQSQPRGLLLRNMFTAGTREPVTATYSASCCQTRVTITAFDLSNNQKTLTLDVTDIWLSEAAIAAVVLGVILLIALIVLLVILCLWCRKRRKASQELPIYRSQTRSRVNS